MYKNADDPSLPERVKKMGAKMRAQWVANYNAAHGKTKGSDGNKSKRATEQADAIHNKVKEELGLDDNGEYAFEKSPAGALYVGRGETFPIATPEDVRTVARQVARVTTENYSPQQLKRRTIEAARKLGESFSAQLPKSWFKDAGIAESADPVKLSEYWDDDECAVPSEPSAPPLVAVPTRVAAQLPEEAQQLYLNAYNMCAVLGGAMWQCDSAGWKSVDAGGFAPDDLPKYVKVGESIEVSGEAGVLFREDASSAGSGAVWDVVLIKAGMSANQRRYSESCLRSGAHLFEGVKAYADHPTAADLRNRSGNRSVTEVVGWYTDARYEEAISSIVAKMHVLESASWLRSILLEMTSNGAPNLIGLSINASGVQTQVREGNKLFMDVTSLTSVDSVDVVTEPAAGGAVVRLVASKQSSNHHPEDSIMDREKIIAALAKLDEAGRKTFLESLDLSDEEKASIRESLPKIEPARDPDPKPEPTPNPDPDPQPDPVRESVTALQESIRILKVDSARNYVAARLAESRMPDNLKTKLREKLTATLDRRLMENVEIDAELREAHELWGAFEQYQGSGRVTGVPQAAGVTSGSDYHDNMLIAIDGMLANADQKNEAGVTIPRFRSIKEAISRWTGKDAFQLGAMEMMRESQTGFDSGLHGDKLLESMTTASWGSVFADRLWRRMVTEYNLPYLDDWKKVVSNIENISDFRTQRRDRIGGYGSTLSTVAEQATYPQLVSPTDEEATYAIVKRGGLDDITLEMIANDDLRNIRNIPIKLARVAKQTLYRYVFDMVATNGFTTNIYDATALYTVAHGNIPGGGAPLALSDNGLAVGWQQMRAQTAFNSALDILATRPKFLIVPTALEQLAWRLANSAVTILSANYNATEPNFFDNKLEVIVVDYLTDTNNWYLVGDPNMIPTIEMGFFNGNEEPELFVQDQPNVGAVMTADKITYKIRHIYAGTVLDYRGFQGSNV